MTRPAIRTHSPAFKVKVAFAAIKGANTLAVLAKQFDAYPNQVKAWKAQLLEARLASSAVSVAPLSRRSTSRNCMPRSAS